MKKEVIVPQLSPQMKLGVLVSWEKQPGQTVAAGEALYEIETDKVVSQIEAEVDGILKDIFAAEGDEVKPGTVIAEIETK